MLCVANRSAVDPPAAQLSHLGHDVLLGSVEQGEAHGPALLNVPNDDTLNFLASSLPLQHCFDAMLTGGGVMDASTVDPGQHVESVSILPVKRGKRVKRCHELATE
jgi:hypothetical protein